MGSCSCKISGRYGPAAVAYEMGPGYFETQQRLMQVNDYEADDCLGELEQEDPKEGEKPDPTIATLLRQEKHEYVFYLLVRGMRLKMTKAVFEILLTLEQMNMNLADDAFRDNESSATLLDISLIYDLDDVSERIMELCPEIVKVKYNSVVYNGQTCLHIAARNGKVTLIEKMLRMLDTEKDSVELLNSVADGRLFRDQRPEISTCLSAAASAGCVDSIQVLVAAGADLSMRGVRGNTLLHSIVCMVDNQIISLETAKKLFRCVYDCSDVWLTRQKKQKLFTQEEARYEAFQNLMSTTNQDGLTAVGLAISNHSLLASFILSFEPVYKRPQVKFGTVGLYAYDVTDILSFLPPSKPNGWWRYNLGSVLHVLTHSNEVFSTGQGVGIARDLAMMEPILTIIKMKWETYRIIYNVWFFIHTVYMLALTTTSLSLHGIHSDHRMIGFVHTDAANSSLAGDNGMIHQHGHTVFLVLPFFYIIFEMIDIVYSIYLTLTSDIADGKRITMYYRSHFCVTGNGLARALGMAFSLSMFAWWIMYKWHNTSCDIPLTMSLICGWVFLTFFTRGCRYVCRFNLIVQKMLFRDFLYFFIAYFIVLVAFSTAMHLLLPHGTSYGKTMYSMLNIVTKAGVWHDKDLTKDTRHYGILLQSIYSIFTLLLLMKMLIAMLNTSFRAIKTSKADIHRHLQLSVLLLLERRFFWLPCVCRMSQSRTWAVPIRVRSTEGTEVHHHYRHFVDVVENTSHIV